MEIQKLYYLKANGKILIDKVITLKSFKPLSHDFQFITEILESLGKPKLLASRSLDKNQIKIDRAEYYPLCVVFQMEL